MGECRGAVKLYSDFLQSDIVVASPIALATKLSDEQKEEEGGPADFLSSIEIAVVDRADVLLMQNWAHVVTGRLPPAQGRQWLSTLCGSCQSAKACCYCVGPFMPCDTSCELFQSVSCDSSIATAKPDALHPLLFA